MSMDMDCPEYINEGITQYNEYICDTFALKQPIDMPVHREIFRITKVAILNKTQILEELEDGIELKFCTVDDVVGSEDNVSSYILLIFPHYDVYGREIYHSTIAAPGEETVTNGNIIIIPGKIVDVTTNYYEDAYETIQNRIMEAVGVITSSLLCFGEG